MADTKIASLTDGTSTSATDRIPVAISPYGSGNNAYITPAYLKTFMVTGGTVTTSTPVFDMTQTWNAGAQTFTGLKLNVTDTASAAGSLLLDLQVGGNPTVQLAKPSGTHKFFLGTYNVNTFLGISATANCTISHNSNLLGQHYALVGDTTGTGGPAQFKFGSGGTITWQSTGSSDSGTTDLILSRAAAATLQHGAADAASPVAQTIGVQNVVAGTSNTAGANFTIRGSAGTGSGAGGSILFKTAAAGAPGTSQNSWLTTGLINSGYVSWVAANFFGSFVGLYDTATDAQAQTSAKRSGLISTASASPYVFLNANGQIGFGSAASGTDVFSTQDTILRRDAANTLALQNGTNAQTFNVYNTWSSAGTNFERMGISWSSNVCYLKNAAGGTGADRLLVPVTGSTTVASLPSAATAGAGARSFVTDASATTYLSTVAGGGANKVPVVSDGTNWLIG